MRADGVLSGQGTCRDFIDTQCTCPHAGQLAWVYFVVVWSDVVCEVPLHLQHSFASKRAVLGFSEEQCWCGE
jgi:hypothetical protein